MGVRCLMEKPTIAAVISALIQPGAALESLEAGSMRSILALIKKRFTVLAGGFLLIRPSKGRSPQTMIISTPSSNRWPRESAVFGGCVAPPIHQPSAATCKPFGAQVGSVKPLCMLFTSSITQVSHTSRAITPETAAKRAAERASSSSRLISFTVFAG